VFVPKRFLHGMELAVNRKSFNRNHIRAVRLNREHRTALHGLAVHLHRASSAQGRFAPDVRAGKPHGFTQVMYQEQTRLHVMGIRLPVDGYGDVHEFLRRY
jgi:hypothetical protein